MQKSHLAYNKTKEDSLTVRLSFLKLKGVKRNDVPACRSMPAACCFVYGEAVSGTAQSHIDMYLLAAGRHSRLFYRG
jgi:hypothetical protein